MKLPFLTDKFENKWVALQEKSQEIVAWARSYKALERKLKKDQKSAVVLLKVPRFDRHWH